MTTAPPPLTEPIYLRKATPGCVPAVRAMLARCSEATLRARFPAATTASADELDSLVGDMRTVTAIELYLDSVRRAGDTATVLAWQGGRVLAAGSILPASEDTAEVALIVEDPWQDKGLGGLLAALLAEVAAAAGVAYLCAYLDTGNVRARTLITRLCPGARFLAPEAGVADVVIPVAAISAEACDQHRIDHTGRWTR